MPESALAPARLGQPLQLASPQGRRLVVALLLSLLFHALLISLTFGGQDFGLPGFALPWQERRAAVPELRVVLAPAKAPEPKPAPASAPLPPLPALTEKAVASGPAMVTFKAPEARPAQAATPSKPRSAAKEKTSPKPKAAKGAPAAKPPKSAAKAKAGAKAKAAPPPASAARSAPKA